MKLFRNSKLIKGLTIGSLTLVLTLISPSSQDIDDLWKGNTNLESIIRNEEKGMIELSKKLEKVENGEVETFTYYNYPFSEKNSVKKEIDYDFIRETNNEKLKQYYFEQMILRMEDEYDISPPSQLKRVAYRGNERPKGFMSITFQNINPEDKGETELEVILSAYENAFDLENEDDFKSIIFHEYNHIRAFSRKKIMNQPKPYLFGYTDLRWKDLYDMDNYGDETYNHVIREMVRRNISEMLAVGEQIYLSEYVLNNSPDYKEGRYDAYYDHYIRLQSAFDVLDADSEFREEIENTFYQPWFDQRTLPLHNLFNNIDGEIYNL